MDRLIELAHFLKTRRARISPTQVGLPQRSRRRTPGLRREEVAELAGISNTWYTWLEQARPVNVSAATLEKISHALLLSADETAYLFKLAQLPALETRQPGYRQISDHLLSVVAGMTTNPAYVIGPRWDLLGWNELADRVLAFSQLDQSSRSNIFRATFTSPLYKQLWVNWEQDARELIADLRSDYKENTEDNGSYHDLVNELTAASPEFAQWWQEHEVKQRTSWIKVLNHPVVGELHLDSIVLQVPAHRYPRVILYSGSTEEDCAKLEKLRVRTVQAP